MTLGYTVPGAHNVNGVSHLFSKDFVHHFRGPMPAGFEGLRQIGIMMNGAFPDVVVSEEYRNRLRKMLDAEVEYN
jgi:hypothetical protein